MRPVYLHVSYMAITYDSGDKITYGSALLECSHKNMTATEIRLAVSKEFGIDAENVQLMSISVLPKRVYKMLKGIQ